MATQYRATINVDANTLPFDTKVAKVISRKPPVLTVDVKGKETLTQVSKVANEAGQVFTKTTKEVIKMGDNTAQATGEMEKGLRGASGAAKETGQKLTEIIPKVAKFLVATTIIAGFTRGVGEAFQMIKDFDGALTEFKKVSDLSGESLTEYTKKLGQMGQEVARTRAEMVESATEFKKSGYSDDDAAILARVSSLFQNVADSQLSAGDSATFLISQMKAFNISAKDSEHIIDAVNEVSNNFAVSSTNLQAGLSKTSSAMGVLGNTFEQTLGLLTGAGEIMQNQSGKIARGLKFQRFYVLDPHIKTTLIDGNISQYLTY